MADLSPRAQRVADQLQQELAILIQTEISDPRVGMVSVISVDVSRDLAFATAYITVLNSPHDGAALSSENAAPDAQRSTLDQLEIEQNLEVLNKAAGFLRSLLAKRLKLRAVPKLKFKYDGSIEKGQYLSSLIDSALAADKAQQS